MPFSIPFCRCETDPKPRGQRHPSRVGSSGSRIVLLTEPSHDRQITVVISAFVPGHSGGTATDSHRLPHTRDARSVTPRARSFKLRSTRNPQSAPGICRPLRGLFRSLIALFLGLTPQARYLSRLRRSRTREPDLWCGRLGRTSSITVESCGRDARTKTPLRKSSAKAT